MENLIFYCPLEYRYSQANEHTLVIGLVHYEQKCGKIAFEFDKIKVQENIYSHYPKVQFTIIEMYLELIRKKITKNPVEKYWNEIKLKQYLANYVLTPDDSALQFGKITTNIETTNKQ